MKRVLSFLVVLLVLMLAVVPAQAATPYRTYTVGTTPQLVETQTAYEPVRYMTDFGDVTLDDPQDMRLGPDGNLYIADNGERYVLVISPKGELIKTIGSKKTLRSAYGVFVDDNLNVYVADQNGNQVVAFDQDGNVLRTFTKPDHPLYGDAPFKPNKVVLDKRGNLYIASQGSTNGIVQISPAGDDENGEFLGYYGANTSSVSFVMAIMQQVLSDEQLSLLGSVVPPSVTNLTIDEKGMVYTVSPADDFRVLRRLNVAGTNTLNVKAWVRNDGETNAAVSVHPSGSIFTVTNSGTIIEYSSEGDLLFYFGSTGTTRIGNFSTVTGIAVDADYNLYVLDSQQKCIQVLQPTEFTNLVHEAYTLFKDGKYAASKAPWTQVLRMNSMFTYASVGLGEALYRENNFEEAMDAFRNGGNYNGYSDAFWEQRSTMMHDYLGTVLIWLVVIIVAWQVIKRLNRRFHFLDTIGKAWRWFTGLKYVRQTGFCLHMLRNPYDCCYGIKREGKAGWLSACVVMLIFFVEFVLNKYFSGFLFKSTPDGYYELFNDAVLVFGMFLMLVICCYLVCTIREGEARLKDLFIGGAYALAPMLVFQPINLLLSNVLTYNEEFFITLINFVSIGWTVVLIVLVIMYMNDYSFKQTLSTIIITAFTVLVMVCLMFVLYVLISQLVDFLASIYGEVVYRFVKKV